MTIADLTELCQVSSFNNSTEIPIYCLYICYILLHKHDGFLLFLR